MVRFCIYVLLLMAAVAVGVYESASHWLPGARDTQGNLNIEALKAIAAALATAVAALIAAGASILNVGLQLRAGKSLEQTKRRLAGELEKQKNRYTRQMERYKNRLAAQKTEVERKLTLLLQAEDIASDYRSVIGLMRQGQYQQEEIERLQTKVQSAGHRLDGNDELSDLWKKFAQKGYYLYELASPLKAAKAYRATWHRLNEAGRPLGIDFARSADEVLEKIRDQRLAIVEAASQVEAEAEAEEDGTE